MRRRLWSTALVTLTIWVGVAGLLARPMNVHSGTFSLFFTLLAIWVLAVPIALSLWIRRGILREGGRGKP